MKKLSLLFLLLLMSFNANAAFLNGQTVTYQWYFPDTSTALDINGSGDYVVGPGTEVSSVLFDMDFSDSNILISFKTEGFFIGDESVDFTVPVDLFSGFKITDTFGTIPDFGSFSINPITNMVGFDLSRITLFSDEIWVNFQGLSFDNNTIVSLDIMPSAVPIPAAVLMFAPALLGFMGLRHRAKKKLA